MLHRLGLVVLMAVCCLFFMPLHTVSADPYRWNTIRIGAHLVHDSEQGEGVKVAVIDEESVWRSY